MQKKFFPPHLVFFEHADVAELFEIDGSRLPLGDAAVYQIGDAAIRLNEELLDELVSVDVAGLPLHMLDRVFEQRLRGADFVAGPGRCLADCFEHVQGPFLPSLCGGHIEQEAVVVALGPVDMAGQVERRLIEQVAFDEIEQVEYATGSAVAVSERMDDLELIVPCGHAHQRVDVVVGMQERFPVDEFFAQQCFAFGWGVNDLAGAIVDQLGAGRAADVQLNVFDDAADFDGQIGVQGALGQSPLPVVEGGAVTQCLFRRRV